MLKTIDRIEEKYFSADATVAPGGHLRAVAVAAPACTTDHHAAGTALEVHTRGTESSTSP
ncbi:hypothetical protein [Nonomuraea sediminis]|uniref:hypothetical protein n=1 Tax=Nonomuraea sediminis TaxID=2835864 RepID=UPI001BDC2E71|nr:hypothetical protein [Nonomuraea sediminis]